MGSENNETPRLTIARRDGGEGDELAMPLEGFQRHALVIVNLVNPKEKFWGVLVSLSATGLTIRGINIEAFDDWVRQITRGPGEDDTIDLVTMFVPLFRVEKIFLDEPVGSVKSYAQHFFDVVGKTPAEYLGLA
jgi:hypothetical protein